MDRPCLTAHKNRFFDYSPGIKAIDMDSKSERLAGASFRSKVCIFNMNPKKRSLFLNGHEGNVFDVTFNKSGTLVASGGKDRTVLIYQSPTELCSTKFTSLNCHFGEVHSVEFNNDGEYLLTGASDKMVRVISLHKENKVLHYVKHKNWVRCARYAKSNNYFVSGADDGIILLWDFRIHKIINSVSMSRNVIKVATDSTDRHFVGVTKAGVSIYDARVFKRLQHYTPDDLSDFVCAHFHPTMPWLLMAQANGGVLITDLASGNSIYQKSGLLQSLSDAKFSRCGKYFVVSGKSSQAQVQVFLLDWKETVDNSSKTGILSSNKSVLKLVQSSAESTSGAIERSKGIRIDNLKKLVIPSSNSNSNIGSSGPTTSSTYPLGQIEPSTTFSSLGPIGSSTKSSFGPLGPSTSSSSVGSKSLEINPLEQMSGLSINLPYGSETFASGYSLFNMNKVPDARYPFIGSNDGTAIFQPVKSVIDADQYKPISNVPCASHQLEPELLTENVNPLNLGLNRQHLTEGHQGYANTSQATKRDDLVDELDDVMLKCSFSFQKLRSLERKITSMSNSLISKGSETTYLDKSSSTDSLRNFKNWLVEMEGALSVHREQMIKYEAKLRREYNKTKM